MEKPPPTPEEAFYGTPRPPESPAPPKEETPVENMPLEATEKAYTPLPPPVLTVVASTETPSGMNAYDQYINERQLRLLAGPLGLVYMGRPEVAAHLDYVPARPSDAIAIPYYDLDGSPMMDGTAPYLRLRMLSSGPGSAKYLQKKNTLPHAYFTPASAVPSSFGLTEGGASHILDWPTLLSTPSKPILFTEGELKAARVNICNGVGGNFPPCIGLGGVDSYGGKAAGLPLLPELMAFEWKDRTVYICFDADEGTNGYKSTVQAAIDRFASTLIGLGAKPQIVHLGAAAAGNLQIAKDAKIGLDDYILAGGTWSVLSLTAEEANPKDAMRQILANYVEIQNKVLVVDVQTGDIMTVNGFLISTAKRFTTVNAKGERVSLGNQFFLSDRHTRVTRYGCWPAHPSGLASIPVIEADGGLPTDLGWDAMDTTLVYNSFMPPSGWFRTTQAGVLDAHAIVIWKEFVSRFFCADPNLAQLFHDWIAYPLRHPDQRNYTSWVFQSQEHGIGKSLIAETVARLVGPRLGLIGGPETFGARFNYDLMGKKFVTINEVMDDKGFHRQFKAYRTNDIISYEQKHVAVIRNRNYANYLITTNEAVAYRIDPTERRDIVYSPPYLSTDSAWCDYLDNTVVPAVVSAEGLKALLTWYRYDYAPTPGYSGAKRAPVTAARERMTEASASDNERAARELIKELIEATPMPVIENRALREGLRGSAYDSLRVTEHLKRLAGAAGTGSTTYKAADGTPQRVLILSGSVEAFRKLTRLEKEQAIADSAQALMGWLQGV